MGSDRRLEAVGDLDRLGAARQVGNQEAELVAAEPGVQVARLAGAFEREEILGADLVRQDPRHPLDDPVADRMAVGVVVPLEAVDIDDADAAPADPLLDREERLDPLHEPVEVEQLGLRVAVRLLGQVGDDVLEVAGDVADGDVLLGQLLLQPLELGGEALGQRADGLVLGVLEQLALAGDDTVDGVEQLTGPRLVGTKAVRRPIARSSAALLGTVLTRRVGPLRRVV